MKARIIAFYLPQYHPIPENDLWWGKGFTEWTNAAKAKPLYEGHYQPHIPADLGFYDLRLPEARIAQAELASAYGIEGFCYYHYWFAGKRLIERPFNEVLSSNEPDFPFCLCWANQSWSGIWHGAPDKILMRQTYPGFADHRQHFECLLKAFCDHRYIRIAQKPVFIVYRPMEIPETHRFTDYWREMAHQSGLAGLYMIGIHEDEAWNPNEFGYDASITPRLPHIGQWRTRWISWRQPIRKLTALNVIKSNKPEIYHYAEQAPRFVQKPKPGIENYPCAIPNWDNTPRSGMRGMVLHGSTPELFRSQFRKALEIVSGLEDEKKIVFIKAWNEWAEGNYLEPDQKFGHGYLRVIQQELMRA